MDILLADDHDLLRDVLKSYLEGLDLHIAVRHARTLPEALAAAEKPPALDLILLDIDMPGMNGLEGLDRMRQLHPGVPVAMLSGLNEPAKIVEALRKGAAGFIPKSIGARAMVQAIQLILAGERYVPSLVLDQVDAGLAGSDEAAKLPETVSLTKEEETVLRLLKEGASNKEIARTLDVQEYTVKYYMRGLFKKLGAKNRTHAVIIAAGRDQTATRG